MRWERPATVFWRRLTAPRAPVRAAVDAREAVRPLGLEIRAGVHTGEVEVVEATSRGSPCSARARRSPFRAKCSSRHCEGSRRRLRHRVRRARRARAEGRSGNLEAVCRSLRLRRATREVGRQYRLPGRGRRAVRPHLGAGLISNVEASWEIPEYAHFLDRLASFSRLILFDKRGLLRTPLPSIACLHWKQRMDDVRAVLDAAGSDRAALFGASEGGNLSVPSLRHIRPAFGRSSCSQHSPSGYGARIIPGHPPRRTETV